MAERALRTISLGAAAAALLTACGNEAPAPSNAAAAAEPAPQPQGPAALAERLVRQRVRGELRFGATRVYANGDVPIVCGTYAEAGRPEQRFVAVSDVDVWIEPEMAPGQMDRAFAQYCRDGAANA